jgi:hypothetical protein
VFDSSSGSGGEKSHESSSQSSGAPQSSSSSIQWSSSTPWSSSWDGSASYTTTSSGAYQSDYGHGNKTGHHGNGGSRPAVSPHIFVENLTETYSGTALSSSVSSVQTDAPAQETKKSAASATRDSFLSFTFSLLIIITRSF